MGFYFYILREIFLAIGIFTEIGIFYRNLEIVQNLLYMKILYEILSKQKTVVSYFYDMSLYYLSIRL
jgi:hypothetical protein